VTISTLLNTKAVINDGFCVLQLDEGRLSEIKKMLAIKKELDYLSGRYKGEHRADD
jgi:hypothetical protein